MNNILKSIFSPNSIIATVINILIYGVVSFGPLLILITFIDSRFNERLGEGVSNVIAFSVYVVIIALFLMYVLRSYKAAKQKTDFEFGVYNTPYERLSYKELPDKNKRLLKTLITILIVYFVVVVLISNYFSLTEGYATKFLDAPPSFMIYFIFSLITIPLFDTLVLKGYLYEQYLKAELIFSSFYTEILKLSLASGGVDDEDLEIINTRDMQNAGLILLYTIFFTLIQHVIYSVGFADGLLYPLLILTGLILANFFIHTKNLKETLKLHFILNLVIVTFVLLIA